MTDVERLGLFYLGREIDPVTKARGDVSLMYDSSDLQLVALAWVPRT